MSGAGGRRDAGAVGAARAENKVAPARRVAWQLVGARRVRDARMRDLMRGSDELSALDMRDRALATRLALGVVATRGALDGMIDAHLRRGVRLEPRVRDALELTCFELCRLETPTQVAVSQGVELVRAASKRAAGLANAVLRRVAEEDAPRVRAAYVRLSRGAVELADVALWTGLPTWLVDALSRPLDMEALRELALSHLEAAPVWIAANRALRDCDEFVAHCEARGLALTATPLPACYELGNPSGLVRSNIVRAAEAFPADMAAQLVARIAAPAAGERLLEVGCGRGTKTALLALAARALVGGDAAPGTARIVATDVDAAKVALTKERLERAGLAGGLAATAIDGRLLATSEAEALLGGDFDAVFLDAPCSGTGTMRRHPEICWALAPEALDPTCEESLPALQLDLLRATSSRVRVGGALVYSTCSVLRAEDEDVVRAFLASEEGHGFRIAPVDAAPGVACLDESARELVGGRMTCEGFFRSSPRVGGCDGHFCARLVRVDG